MTGIISMKIARGMLYLTGGFLSLDNSSEECGVAGMGTYGVLRGYRGLYRPVLQCHKEFLLYLPGQFYMSAVRARESVEPFVCPCSQSISFSLALAPRLDVRGLDEGRVYYVSYSSPFPSIMEFAVVYIFERCSELIRKYSQAGGNGKDNSVIVKRDILQRE